MVQSLVQHAGGIQDVNIIDAIIAVNTKDVVSGIWSYRQTFVIQPDTCGGCACNTTSRIVYDGLPGDCLHAGSPI